MAELEQKFGLLFDKLKVVNTADIVNKTVKPVIIKKEIPEGIAKAYEKRSFGNSSRRRPAPA